MKTRRVSNSFSQFVAIGVVVVLLAAIFSSGCRKAPPPRVLPSQRERYLVGAHCYQWYPSNLRQGYLRGKLVPPQEPMLGKYDSLDPKTAEQHISWCSRYGIDFLTLDWWPSRAKHHEKAVDAFIRASNIADIRFCIFYETWSLGFDRKTGCTVFTEENIERFGREIGLFADRYFPHPSYLKIDGRPVLVLYITRTFFGLYAEALAHVRASARERGFDLYIIGDEVFWSAIDDEPNAEGKPVGTVKIQMGRISLLDAITAYNMYEWPRKTHAGYGARSAFVSEVRGIYEEFASAARGRVSFIPAILSGYNDRGVRLREDHYVIPRQWDEGMAEGSFLAECFDRLAFPFIDPTVNMVLITSWNEWNEDTAIEPMKQSEETRHDNSGTGSRYTEGFLYRAHGTQHLEVIRDKVVAVCGRVTRGDGTGCSGVLIRAWRGDSAVASDVSDSRGYYRLSRLHMPAGTYEVGPIPRDLHRSVTVEAGRATLGVDFAVAGE